MSCTWWTTLFPKAALARKAAGGGRRPTIRPHLTRLEDRTVPAVIALDTVDVGVATTSSGEQAPDIAVRPDGKGYVVAWQAPDGGGSGGGADLGIYFRQYDANWQPTGAAVRANTFTTNLQDRPSVGIDGSGNFVIAWNSFDQFSASSYVDVYARRYTAAGTAVDAGEFLVNTATAGNGNAYQDPDVAVNASGQFVVAWWGGTFLSEDIRAKGYASVTGTLTATFAETTINNTAANSDDQIDPAVAIDPSGNFVVAYESYQQDAADGGYAIIGRRANANGTVNGTEFLVNTVTAGSQIEPDVAMDGGGNFVIVWTSPGVDTSGSGVVMQRYSAAGAALGGNTLVNTVITAGTQGDAHVSRAAGGDYVVTWDGEEADGNGVGGDTYYKKYDSAGAVLLADTRANATANDNATQANAVPAVDAAGDFVIAWEDGAGTGASYDIDLRRFGNAPTVAYTAASSSGDESVSPAIGLTRSGAQYVLANLGTTVTVTDAGTGTATAGSDYTAFNGSSVTFAATAGLTSGTQSASQAIAVIDDTMDEPNETIGLGLGAVTGGTASGQTTHTYTILDNDPPPAISVSSPSVAEGNSGTTPLAFTVSLAAASGFTVTVNFATADGTATTSDGDYAATSGTLTFAPGQTSKTVTVTVNGDTKYEANETLALNLTGATNTSNATASGTGTVVNDDAAPSVSLSVSPASIAEAAGSSTVTATLSAASGVNTTVTLSLGGTATLNADYTISSTTITIPAGSTTGTATITAVQDTVDETNETVTVGIGSATNATIGGTTQTVTIIDDDPNPTANGQSVTTDQNVAVPITLTGTEGSTPPLSLTYTITTAPAHGTLTGTAPNLTYTPTAGYSGPDSFQFTDSNGANTSGPATVSITVTPASQVSINDATVTEGDSGTNTATFTVTLSNASGQTVSVNYATANNTATAGSDYVATSGTLTFAPGQTSKTVSVTVNGDTLFEGDETYFVNLSGLSYGTFSDNQGTGTITDDDAAASLTIVSGNNQSTVVSTAFAAPLVAIVKNAAGNPVQGVAVTFAPPGSGASVTFATPTPVSNASGQVSTGTATANGTAGGPYAVTATATGGSAPSATFSLTNLPATSFAINDVSVTEGNSGTKLMTFTVTASPVNNVSTSTVNFATADGTATTADGDYVAASGTLTFAPGVTTQTFTVTINGDAKFEADETFVVNLSGATNAGISDNQGVGTIVNDDTAPTVSVNSVSAAEGNAGTTPFAFTVSLSAASGATTTVNYATADGSALAGSDYTAASGTLTFAPGQTTKTVTVLVSGDTVFEADQTFNLTLSAPTNATLGTATGTGTIANDDAAPTLAINDVSVSEAAGTVTFTVTRTGATEVPIAVAYATADGTAVSTASGPGTPDYTATGGTLNFVPSLAATATQTFTVPITNDSVYEAVEQFTANLSAATNATIADAQGIATITDDDAAPTLAISSQTVSEAAGTMTFTVTLTGATSLPIAVNYATADGTAVSTASAAPGTPDYTATGGTLTFNPSAAGTQTLTFSVPIVNDAVFEPTEQFTASLSGPTNGATISTATGTGTITDDDPVPSLSVGGVTRAEGNAGTTVFTFTVSLSAASTQTVTVNYVTADGTATAGSDYTATGGTLTFAPGQTSKTVTVLVTGDTVYENDETFTLVLSAPTNATVAAGTGTGTITNDDAAPTLSVNDVTVSEGGTLTFTVTLTGATSLPIAVNYATADGSAKSTAGGPGTPDFTATSGTLTFSPSASGTQTLTVTVPLTNDGTNEPTEQFALNLSGATNGATVARGTGAATVTDDDAVPSVSVGDVTAAEGDSGTTAFTFTVTLGAASGQAVTVGYATADGTALAGSDYSATSGTLTFAPGQTTGTVTVLVTGDTTVEGTEAFFLNLTAPTNAAIADAQGVGTITDDDAPPVAAVAGPTASAEGSAVTFTGTFTDRAGAANGPYTYRWHVAASNGQAVPDAAGTAPAYGTVPAFAFTPNDDGTYVVTLTVTDRDGATGPTATATLTVANANPTATLVNDGPRAASGPVTVTFTNVADPSAVDSAAGLRYGFDFNDDGDFTDPDEVQNSPSPSAVFDAPSAGTFTVHGRVTDKNGGSSDVFTTVVVGRVRLTAASAGGDVQVYNADGSGRFAVHPFPGFGGPVSVAVGDVTGDGFDDLVVGSGGVASHVKVFDGRTFAQVATFFAYQPEFAGGVNVAAADLFGTGRAQVVTGAGAGGAPHVKVFDLANGNPPVDENGNSVAARSFLAYDAAFRGGVNVAAGVLDASGHAKLVTGAGPGGGPHVRVFDVSAGNPAIDANGHSVDERSFFPYATGFGGGVFVAADDGLIVTGAGAGGGPHVRAYRYPDVVNSQSAFPFTATDSTPQPELGSSPAPTGTFTAGVRVGLGEYGGQPVVLVGSGPGMAPHLKVLRRADLSELAELDLGDGTSGVFVG